jgi:hypothetical protein
MRRDAARQRTDAQGAQRPTVFTSLTADPQAAAVSAWITGLIAQRRATAHAAAGPA